MGSLQRDSLMYEEREDLVTRLLLIYQKLSYKAKLIKISCSGL